MRMTLLLILTLVLFGGVTSAQETRIISKNDDSGDLRRETIYSPQDKEHCLGIDRLIYDYNTIMMHDTRAEYIYTDQHADGTNYKRVVISYGTDGEILLSEEFFADQVARDKGFKGFFTYR